MVQRLNELSRSRRGLLATGAGLTAGLAAAPITRAAAPPAARMAPALAPQDVPHAELAYEAIVTLGPAEVIGQTPHGKRIRVPITGGTFKGPRLSGTVFPEGMDWQLARPDGMTEIEASYLMRENDGTVIQITNKGVAGKGYARTAATFEVPNGPHAWLNEAVFVGTLGPVPELSTPAVRIRMFKLV